MKNPPIWPKPLSEADELEIRAAIAEREPKESAFARFEDEREVKLIVPVLCQFVESLAK